MDVSTVQDDATHMNIALFYGSLTGNTMLISEQLSTHLQSKGHHVTMEDQSLVDIINLKNFDLVIFGASTWGEGDANPTTESFLVTLNDPLTNLGGVQYAIFGLGDRSYEHFCGVVDKLEQTLQTKKAHQVFPSLRLEGFPDESMQECIEKWIGNVLEKCLPQPEATV